MQTRVITVPPGYMPPAPYETFGKMTHGQVFYTVTRPYPRLTLPMVYEEGAKEPADFKAYFAQCAREESAP